MDTKRHSDTEYLHSLSLFYQEKYRAQQFDLIIASDDAATYFLIESAADIFPNTPMVFCGANEIDMQKLQQHGNITGITEYTDIRGTLDLILTLQPDITQLVVINDTTISGQYVAEELNRIIPDYSPKLKFIFLENLPPQELATQLANLSPSTAVLLLLYIQDSTGKYLDPGISAQILSQTSSVPVYSVWDFYFNHGIAGGVLTSGYLQGETAAKIAIRLLLGGQTKDIPIVKAGGNRVMFDYRQMKRFGLAIEALPHTAVVSNINYGKKKNVLVLHSYSANNNWTRQISKGIEEQFAATKIETTLFIEFMDTKRYSDKPYLHALTDILKIKYASTDLDLIIVSDDNAYNFAVNQRDLLFPETPIVFCGVNYLKNPQSMPAKGITGVVESYDVLSTLQLGLTLFPETQTFFVINDATTSGLANREKVTSIVSSLPAHVRVEHSGHLSMQELQHTVANLDNATTVLLGAFTTDRNNQRFSFSDSAEIITESSSRPVLSFWDFYLGHGITGGAITSGYDQGKIAAHQALALLEGKAISSVPVIKHNPIVPTVDYAVMQKFGAKLESIPAGTRILNKPVSMFEQYKTVIYTFVWIIGLLVLITCILGMKILIQKKHHLALSTKAETDPLTGVKNRAYFFSALKAGIESSNDRNEPFILCYFDLDNLKSINDTMGHAAGDKYILLTVNTIRKNIRVDDIICRIGGDEFVLLLPNYSEKQAIALSTKVNQEIRNSDFTSTLPIGVSCGISTYNPAKPISKDDLIAQADTMMYLQKQQRQQADMSNTKT